MPMISGNVSKTCSDEKLKEKDSLEKNFYLIQKGGAKLKQLESNLSNNEKKSSSINSKNANDTNNINNKKDNKIIFPQKLSFNKLFEETNSLSSTSETKFVYNSESSRLSDQDQLSIPKANSNNIVSQFYNSQE